LNKFWLWWTILGVCFTVGAPFSEANANSSRLGGFLIGLFVFLLPGLAMLSAEHKLKEEGKKMREQMDNEYHEYRHKLHGRKE